MGRVYRVRDRQSGRDVALKTLQSFSAEDVFRLKKEFRTLGAVSHPNVVQLYDLVVGDDECFFTMELVDGPDFVQYARRHPDNLRATLRGVADGLQALHGAGVLHRDVKPSNVLVGSDDRAVLLDFGLAFQSASRLSRDSRAAGLTGTFEYMAPEQAWGDAADPAADWYNVGVMLFEALTGELPFPEATLASLLERRSAAPPRPSRVCAGVPDDLDDLVVALLDPVPERRPDAAGVRRVLDVRSHPHPHPHPHPQPGPMAQPSREAPFVNRTAELAALRLAFEATRRGVPGIALLRGGSGIGKTALVRKFAAELAGLDVPMLQSRCHPHESVPFKAFDGLIDELSRMLCRLTRDQLAAVMPRNVRALHQLFPILGRVPFEIPDSAPPLSAADPHELRRRGFTALREMLGRISERQALACWIDDAHWGDADSEALMRELTRAPDAPSVLWIATYRSGYEERAAFPALLEEIAADFDLANVCSRELGPLAVDDVRELVESMSETSPPVDASIDDLARESGGSPLFVGELVRYGRQSDVVGAQSVRLVDAIRSRVEALTAASKRLLAILAAHGEPTPLDLAVELSGLESDERRVIASLEDKRLVRLESSGEGMGIELYHDRVRSAVTAALDPEGLREAHLAIARALERLPDADAQALHRHYLEGDDPVRAARYALRAAEAASRLLAFERAAQLYRSALELDPDAVDRGDVLPRLAEALANGGRGVEAAQVFGECAETPGFDAVAVRRFRLSAAEQLMKSGLVDEGVASLRPLLAEAGIFYPPTPRSALIRTFWNLALLWLRGTRFRETPEHVVPAERLEAIDLCSALGKGLGAVDSIRAAYFQFRGALEALRSGEPYRAGRNLVLVGAGALGPSGGGIGRWGRRLVELARNIADRSDDAELRGIVATGAGQTHFFAGQWREALDESDRGLQILGEHGRAVFWERDIGRMAATRSLEELGRLAELRARSAEWEASARELGDRFGEVTALMNRAWTDLASGDPKAARANARRVVQMWSHEGFHVQHLYAMRVELYCDLYEAAPEAAWERLEGSWRELRRSFLLQFPMTVIDVYSARARIALAVADRGDVRRPKFLGEARRAVRRVEKEGRADGSGHAASLSACLAAVRGDGPRSAARLALAGERYRAAGMSLCGAQVALAAASVAGTAEAVRLSHEARAALLAEGVREPERWAGIFMPGFALAPQVA